MSVLVASATTCSPRSFSFSLALFARSLSTSSPLGGGGGVLRLCLAASQLRPFLSVSLPLTPVFFFFSFDFLLPSDFFPRKYESDRVRFVARSAWRPVRRRVPAAPSPPPRPSLRSACSFHYYPFHFIPAREYSSLPPSLLSVLPTSCGFFLSLSDSLFIARARANAYVILGFRASSRRGRTEHIAERDTEVRRRREAWTRRGCEGG